MGRSQRNDNFIDKTFTVIADILLKVLPASKQEKQALLKIFVTEQGKILPRRATGITVQQQRRLAKAVKRARILALLPFVTSNQNP